jgi:hypothetical protein
MIRTLTLQQWNPALNNYNAGVTQTLAQWGIADDFSGGFRSQTADELQLNFPGQALNATTPFTYRSRITLTFDGKPFFQGYVIDDVERDYDGTRNAGTVKCAGPWWYLENLVLLLTVQVVTGYTMATPPAPILTAQTFTHFTLNQGINTSTPNGGVLYTPVVLNSQAQLAAVLNFAIAAGAWLQFNQASLMAQPVLPRDVMNITCADAIRRQMEDFDCVSWIDHTTTPPTFNCKQRSALPNVTQSIATAATLQQLGLAVKAMGFQKLHQRMDLAVPSVRIDFEQTNTFDGQTGLNVVSDIYPKPLPADQLKALIVTVPIRGFSASQTFQFIQTAPIAAGSLDWLNLVKTETNPAVNPNAAVEFSGLTIQSSSRQSATVLPAGDARINLPNMIIAGGYSTWMGGNYYEDNIDVVCSYERQASAVLTGTKVAAHTFKVNCHTTDLNYPNGTLLSQLNINSAGENPNSYLGLAQAVWTDYNAPQWEGEIPMFEGVYTGSITLGVNYNLTNSLPAHAAMNAVAQEISFTSKAGGLFYRVSLGPNKKISPGQFADRLRAKRMAYITVATFAVAPSAPAVTGPQAMKMSNTSSAEPQKTQDHIVDATGAVIGGVLLQGGGGSPAIAIQCYDNGGNVLTPGSGTARGRILLNQSATMGSDGKWHDVLLREYKLAYKRPDGSCTTRSVIGPFSDIFIGSGDVA